MYTLDQVRCFVAVAEHLHFGRAAEELRMTQPPLSRQIQKLERFVGTALFERDNRHVQLTTAGRLFLVESRKLLGLAERAPEGARRAASGQWGQVALGFTAGSGFSLLGNLLALVEEREPEIAVDLVEMVTSEQLQALEEERLDVALGRVRSTPPGLTSKLLLSEKLVLAVPSDHELATRGRPLVRADVANRPLILHSPTKARYFYDLVVRHFDIDHHWVHFSLGQILTMINLVASGHGIAFVPESTRFIRVRGVEFLTFEDFQDDVVELRALWNPDNRNPALARFLTAIRL